ncbi:adenosylcobinamide-GDP ribazoletransferase [Aquihabitans daechungensis]|uniref:adenosylcobinamide-GDP ribazoletransferase n=1 Tax=Aquihabitans daechungensis TaxID=1052257 RepID=UPI003B9FFAC1
MLSALSFLTVFGRGRTPGPATFRWFPAVGAAIGAIVALTLAGARELWILPVAAAIAVAVDLVVTGMLHVDGLADSADGLLPHLDAERRLEVMRQPDTGAFALGAVLVVFLLRWSALTDPRVEPWSVAAVWCISRTMVAVVPAVVPYARAEGLASALLDGTTAWTAVAVLPALVLLAWAQGATGVLAGLAALAAGAALVALAHRRIGGFTGDVLGAAVLVSETTALLVLAAHP